MPNQDWKKKRANSKRAKTELKKKRKVQRANMERWRNLPPTAWSEARKAVYEKIGMEHINAE